MDLELTEDQAATREAFRSFFDKESTPALVRHAEPLGFDAGLWTRLAQTGAPGMAVPASIGGGDATLVDVVLVAEQLGRTVAPVPLIDHVSAVRALVAAGWRSPWLADAVSGEVIAAFALNPARDGMAPAVPAGAVADVIVGLDGDEWVAVRSQPPWETPANHACAPLASRSLRSADRAVLATGAAARAAYELTLDEWKILTAATLVGVAERSLEIALDYVKARHQFGRPIGSFQAIQHGLADLVAPLDGIRLLTARAAWTVDGGTVPDRVRLATMAWLAAVDLARSATARSLHYHGGYGATTEYDIQLYFRRARGWPLALGDPAVVADRLAATLFGTPAPPAAPSPSSVASPS